MGSSGYSNTESGDIFIRLTNSNNGGIITIVDGDEIVSPYSSDLGREWHLYYKIGIETLQLTSFLPELNQVEPPNIYISDSQAEREAKRQEVKQAAQRYRLQLYFANGGNDWQEGPHILLCNYGYPHTEPLNIPYLTLNEVRLLGRNSKIGCRIEDEDFGLLKARDRCWIQGTYSLTVGQVEKISVREGLLTRRISSIVGSTSPVRVRPSLSTRKLLWLQNVGDAPCWVFVGNSSDFVRGECQRLETGNSLSWESDKYFLPGEIWAQTDSGPAKLVGEEGWL